MISEENVRQADRAAVDVVRVGLAIDGGGGRVPQALDASARVRRRSRGCWASTCARRSSISLPEAIRRLTRLPAENLGLDRRGRIEAGYFADIVVFDPATVADTATWAEPHQYAVGVRDVIVNGVAALRDGEFTGALPGRAVYGPGSALSGCLIA